LTSALLENLAGRKDPTQLGVNRPLGFTGVLQTLCPATCAGKQEQDRGKGKNARVRTIGKLSFPSLSFTVYPCVLL